MLWKVLLFALTAMTLTDCAKLPRVYNAVITTDGDEIITPSKAYPLIRTLYPTSFYNIQSNFKDVQQPAVNVAAADEIVGRNNSNSIESTEKHDKKPTKSTAIILNEAGFPPSLIPLQKIPSYSHPYIFDSYGNLQSVVQYPVLPPNYYPQQEFASLPAIEQPLFHVSDKRFESEPPTQEILNNDNFSHDIKNYENKNTDIPDVEIPPIPIRKN